MPYSQFSGAGQPGAMPYQATGYAADPTMIQQQLAQNQQATQANQWNKQFQFGVNKWNDIAGMLKGAFGTGFGAGGVATPNIMTPINTSPIWNPQQIQAKQNQIYGQGQAQLGTSLRDIGNQAAAAGRGAMSPFASAMGQAAKGMQNMASQAAATNWDQQAAQMNAQQIAQTQQMRANQAAAQGQLQVEAQKPLWAYRNSLIGALAGA